MLRAKCMKARSIRAGSNPAGSRGASRDVHHSFANPFFYQLLIAINTQNQRYVLMRMSVRNVVLVGG